METLLLASSGIVTYRATKSGISSNVHESYNTIGRNNPKR
jgi:hypothetical protein